MKAIRRPLTATGLLLLTFAALAAAGRAWPVGNKEGKDVEQFRESWRVLEPITRRNLSIYPVVSDLKVDTSDFLTLDEGLASGDVRIAERGQIENTIYRRRDSRPWPERQDRWPAGGASVNELVLVNSSSRPLLLLAGEVVSGGKQNRIIGADLVVPPKSEPLPLTVFCVEHGRWSAAGAAFAPTNAIAHPEIRREAQASKSQAGVWESVARSSAALGAASETSDYTAVLGAARTKRELDEAALSLEREYERELREQVGSLRAVGVVVAINGEPLWSDVFSSGDLFRKYWPKLLRSYVLEAENFRREGKGVPSPKIAQQFLLEDRGRVSIQSQPGAYRRTEISAGGYQIVALEALEKSQDSGLLLHYEKMTRD